MNSDDVKAIASHACIMARRAVEDIRMVDSLLWKIKIRNDDNPSRSEVDEVNNWLRQTRENVDSVLKDLYDLTEEMKRYKNNS